MRDLLIDILDHTNVGTIDTARISSFDKETRVDCMDADKTVIIQAKLKSQCTEFKNEFGIGGPGRFSTLSGLLNFANFKTDDANIKVLSNSENTPEELVFSNRTTGTYATFRFLSANALTPKAVFKGANWDVVLTPTVSKTLEFSTLAGILSGSVNSFTVKTNNKELIFNLGDSENASDRISLVFDHDVSGTITKNWAWPVVQFLQILKLGKPTDFTLKFSDQGVLLIQLESKLANWEYILPARLK